VQQYVVEFCLLRRKPMRVATAKKIAAENDLSLEYNNDMRLYILKDMDDKQGWPNQYFPGSALREMSEAMFMNFFLRMKE
jgi:hypothetical protein